MTRRWLWHSGLPLAVLLVFVGLVIFGITRLVAIEKTMRIDNATNMLWVLTQTEIEALRMKAVLLETPVSQERVLRQFDLLSSRLDLLLQGPQLRYLEERSLLEEVRSKTAEIARLDPARTSPDSANPTALANVLDSLERTLNRAANRTMVVEWEALSQRLELYRSAVAQVVYSLVGGVVAALYLAWRVVADQRLRQELDRERATVAYWRDFAAVVSHQFRTPLAVIDSAAQRLLRRGRSLEQEALAEKQKTIRDMVASLDRLVDAALLIGQLDHGLRAIDVAATDLVQAVGDLVEDLQMRLQPRIITFESERDAMVALCDRRLVAHILINLVDNASQYSPSDTPVEISLKAGLGEIGCVVRDHGDGIAEADVEMLFERFRRGAGRLSGDGTGIGLWTAYRLAELMDGRISVESRKGEGAAFTLWLPEYLGDGGGVEQQGENSGL